MSDHRSWLLDFHARLAGNLFEGGSITKLPDWLLTNTKLKGKPFSFLHHEFQHDIVADAAQELVCKKCSQIGMSELQVRMILGLLAIKQGWTGIYILPHAKFAVKFAKGRIDPVVDGSDRLKKLVVAAANSSEMKRFGLSTLYIGGASTETQAISIPADIMIQDEFDFCNQAILGVYESRLRHAEKGGMKRRFSTPTLNGYGIDLEYSTSSRGHYAVRCEHCEQYQTPIFSEHVVIPGFDDEFKKFNKEDLEEYDIDAAYIRCPGCGKSLDASFAELQRRAWIHEYLTIAKRGYWVKPFDVIHYNPTARVIRQMKDYKRRETYFNYSLGETMASDESEINNEKVGNSMGGIVYDTGMDCAIGIDVGKKVYVTVGRKEEGKYRVFKYMSFNAKDHNLLDSLIKVVEDFNASKVVIDAGPDFSLCQGLLKKFGDIVHPCIYVKDNPKKMEYFELPKDHVHNMVWAQRTMAFNDFVTGINSMTWVFPRSEIMEEVRDHFQGMKRVSEMDEQGNTVHSWKKIKADHFMHSTFYFQLACDILGSDHSKPIPMAPPGILAARISTLVDSSFEVEPERDMGLWGHFGGTSVRW